MGIFLLRIGNFKQVMVYFTCGEQERGEAMRLVLPPIDDSKHLQASCRRDNMTDKVVL